MGEPIRTKNKGNKKVGVVGRSDSICTFTTRGDSLLSMNNSSNFSDIFGRVNGVDGSRTNKAIIVANSKARNFNGIDTDIHKAVVEVENKRQNS